MPEGIVEHARLRPMQARLAFPHSNIGTNASLMAIRAPPTLKSVGTSSILPLAYRPRLRRLCRVCTWMETLLSNVFGVESMLKTGEKR